MAVRKPFQCCRTGCERAHCSTYIMLQQRHFFLSLSASTEPMATLRHGATCGADVAAACANALTSWSDFVRPSDTLVAPPEGPPAAVEKEERGQGGPHGCRHRAGQARHRPGQAAQAIALDFQPFSKSRLPRRRFYNDW
jgi:hypothetical protein